MDAIGGYFELADVEEGVFPHQDGILLNTGRNALEYILIKYFTRKNLYLEDLMMSFLLLIQDTQK